MDTITYAYDRGKRIRITGCNEPPAGGGEPEREGKTAPSGGDAVTTYTYAADAAPPPFGFEHDPTARVFRLTTADGKVEVWRDNPTRFLCVEPDPETGAMRPVMKLGRPVYLYLLREDREAR